MWFSAFKANDVGREAVRKASGEIDPEKDNVRQKKMNRESFR